MNYRKRLASILFFLSPVVMLMPGYAQTGSITGQVTDENGETLTGVNVLVRGTVLGSPTSSTGEFVIKNVPAGRVLLRCSMIGYETHEHFADVPEGSMLRVEIVLRETPVETDEVIVTAGRRPQSLEEVPVSISVMDGRNVEQRGLTLLDQALRYVPGVNVTESQVNIRGSSGYSRAIGSRVLLLIDGIPSLTGDAGEIKFDAVPMFAVDKIEVVKGAGSALYGSNALGGVINVITRQPRKRDARIRLYTGFWSEPRYEQWQWWGDDSQVFNGIDLQYGDLIDKFSWLISAGVRQDESYRQNDDSFKWNLNTGFGYQFEAGEELRMAVNFTSDDHGNWVYWKDIDNALQPPENADLSERILSNKLQASVQYRKTLSADFAYLLRGYSYVVDFETRSDTSDFSMRPYDQTQSTSAVSGLQWQGTYVFSPSNLLTFGIEGSYTVVDSRTYGNRRGAAAAIYAQDEIKFDERWNLSAGVRYDLNSTDSSETDQQVSPRIGLTYVPVAGTTLRTSFGRGFRAPSIAERYATASAGGLLTKPNPDLLSERSSSYELGVQQQLPVPALLDLAVFQSDYDNLIEPVIDPADGRIVFENITKARIRGIEAGIQLWPVPGMLDMTFSYTWMYPRDLNLNETLKYRPRHLFYVNSSLLLGDFRLAADYRFISEIESIDDELVLIIPDADQRVPIHVVDIRLIWEGAISDIPLRTTLAVNNLLNYYYTEVAANIAPIRNVRLIIETSF